MPSSYSTNLKIELQATGENSGTWGTITNTNLGTALEQAIVGYGNPSYASDANLTLTYTDTNAAQAARALVLNVTSAVSLSATRELVVPTIQKQYIVQNNTSGSQSITVKTSAGTGITVPNGRKAHLYVDGTNVIYMDDYVDINGGAIDGTPIGANSASTGAFSTLSASGNVTLSGGTANGVLYLNGSKVATSGSALTFDGSGTFTVGSDAVATVFNAPGDVVQYVVDSNGTGSTASHQWKYGSTEAMRLTSTGLGIGTSSPAYKLQVSTNANADATINASNTTDGTSSVARFLAISNAGSVWFGMTAPSYNAVTGASDACLINTGNASNGICFANDGVLQMKLDSSGNLGLGVTPSAWSTAGKNMQFGNGPASIGTQNSGDANFMHNAYESPAGTFKYASSGIGSLRYQLDINNNAHKWYYAASGTAGNTISFTQAMTLDASGNLGVGTTSPYKTITVGTSDATAWITAGGSDVNLTLSSVGTNGSVVFRTGGTNSNPSTTTERARIDSSGNLGLGTSSPASKLDVTGGFGTSTTAFTIYNNSGASASNIARIDFRVNNSFNGNERVAAIWGLNPNAGANNGGALAFGVSAYGTSTTPSEVARFDQAGNLGLGTTSPKLNTNSGTFLTVSNTTSDQAGWLELQGAPASDGSGSGQVSFNNSNRSGTDKRIAQISALRGAAADSGSIAFTTWNAGTGSERARITSAGYFRASNDGTYFNSTGAYHELRNSAADNIVTITNTSATNPNGMAVVFTAASPNDTANHFIYCQDNAGGGTQRATIRSNGGLANYSANNVNLASDERLKKDISPLASAWNKVKGMEVVNFRYKDCNEGDPLLYGVIAQQVQPVVPELVVVTREATETDPEYYGIREQPMYWLAIKALQEAMTKIEKLEAEVAALKGA